MSGKTWTAEFFPTSVNDVPKNDSLMLEHALKKWQGLLPGNLSKHDVSLCNFHLIESKTSNIVLKINSDTCVFCKFYLKDGCIDCPVFKKLGHRCNATETSPYSLFLFQGDVVPMLECLKSIKKET